MPNQFLSPDGKDRVYRILSAYAAAFGAFAALQQFFGPFTATPVWALVAAVAGAVVFGAVILAYVLFREHRNGRKVLVSVLVVLVVVGAVGGVVVGTLLRAPVSPQAGGTSPAPTAQSTSPTPSSTIPTTTAPVQPIPAPGPTTTGIPEPRPPVTTTTTTTQAPPPPPPPLGFGFSTPDTVTNCTDVRGWGAQPAEGRAVILVQPVGSQNVYFEKPIFFPGDGTWFSDDVTVGNPGQAFDHVLTAQAMTQADVDWYTEKYTNSQDPVSEVRGRPLAAKEFHRSTAPNTC
jgi:hypothetical protein